ncbi:MAG: nucleotidyltransferase domain-containing protein [Novosphingobium sp.]
MSDTIHLTQSERAEVARILAEHLPPGISIRIFGSRAGGTPKPWSDLDLALDGPQPLSLADMAELAEAFDESALPFKVDLVDRHTVSAGFAAIIDAGSLPLPR